MRTTLEFDKLAKLRDDAEEGLAQMRSFKDEPQGWNLVPAAAMFSVLLYLDAIGMIPILDNRQIAAAVAGGFDTGMRIRHL